MTHSAITVIIADDHPLIGVALRLGVQRVVPDAAVIDVSSFAALRDIVQGRTDISLVLLDLMMPDVEGLSALQFLRLEFPALRVAIVSGVQDRHWVRAAQALGAVGFVPKSTPAGTMQDILRRLLDGGTWWPPEAPVDPARTRAPAAMPEEQLDRLSPQELRILLHIKDGRLNKQIAADLGISESTVKTHISTLLRKLGLQSRTQAAVLAQRLLARH